MDLIKNYLIVVKKDTILICILLVKRIVLHKTDFCSKDNNFMEEWSQWLPASIDYGTIAGKVFVDDMRLYREGLSINMATAHNELRIEMLFGGTIVAYRYANESWVFNIFAELSKAYGADFYRMWRFFEIKNSMYVESFIATSCGVSKADKIRHFCILGDDEIIDILATYEPEVRILEP